MRPGGPVPARAYPQVMTGGYDSHWQAVEGRLVDQDSGVVCFPSLVLLAVSPAEQHACVQMVMTMVTDTQ